MQRYLREIRPTLTLAVPIIVGQVSQMLMGVTDSVMIGRTGTVPLAASSFGGSVFSVFYVLSIGLMLPVAVFVSRARGAGRPEESGEYLRHGLALALGFGVLETLLLFALGTQLGHFGQPPEVLAIVGPFFLLISASLTPVLVYLALRQFAEAMGRPWMPMFVMLASVALNVVLNWIFIYGHLGAPALGFTGAGVATLIARTVGSAVIFLWLRRDPAFHAAWPRRWLAPLSGAHLREMLHLGLPAAGMLLFESGAFAASAVMMGWLGAEPLAAHQIAISCVSTTFMFSLGLSMAASLRVSAAMGAGEHARLRPIGLGALALGQGLAAVFTVVYFVAGHVIAGWFVPDAAVVTLAAQLLVVAALFQFFDGGQVIMAAELRGLTDAKVPALITFVAYWVIALPAAYLVGVRGGYGGVGIWGGLAVGLAFAAVFLTLRFVRLTRA
ncbi:MAG: MATE family efflux transporter [Verrucomicrobia bacterium]|nr:MATE family efflux transporter [Verrucomicrobiota bacterium]